jgi:hypothetical protein
MSTTAPSNAPVSLKVEQKNGQIALSGFLDENSALQRLDPLAKLPKILFNFGAVARVNSCGVRDWVNFIAKLTSTEIHYVDCPMVVVKQLNVVPDFQGKAKVDSFFAPYFCESCDQEQLKLLTAASVANGQPPAVNCPTCGKPMGFDAIPNQYFSFLKR